MEGAGEGEGKFGQYMHHGLFFLLGFVCLFQGITLEIQYHFIGKEQLLQSPRYSR